MKSHQAAGRPVVLVSGMFQDLVKMFAERIGADAAPGTPMAYTADGISRGTVAGKTCVGSRKLDFIRDYLAEYAPQTDLATCYGYADSYSDVALLESIGHSTATYPDPQMRRVAVAQGWQILPD